ncbi:MAG: CXXX repeat peptide maturase [Bacteroidales bacterium]|nr:CXXX repeat peptide maturase [Bacteroidales bacterium]
MIQYLMVLLSDKSVSYCQYNAGTDSNAIISVETLRKGVLYAMKNNLSVNFVYPQEELPNEIEQIIESFNNKRIKPFPCVENADIVVTNGIKEFEKSSNVFRANTICRLSKREMFDNQNLLCECINRIDRTNLVITDIETFTDNDFDMYKNILAIFSEKVDIEKHKINILSDRLQITEMNNCNAGVNNITLAPDGNFYICPGFYYSDERQSVGNVDSGLNIKNQQLYKIEYAPICRHCDAYHCKRCIWLNKKTTLEINTPSHEQCVVSHLERNATRNWLLKHLDKQKEYDNVNIKELSYLDPFDEHKNWK